MTATSTNGDSFSGDLRNVLQIVLGLIDPAYGGNTRKTLQVNRSTLQAIARRVTHALTIAPSEDDAEKLEWIRHNSEHFYNNGKGWWLRSFSADGSVNYDKYKVLGPFSTMDYAISVGRLYTPKTAKAFIELFEQIRIAAQANPNAANQWIEEIRAGRKVKP